MNNPQRQHIVPECILRHFTNNEGVLHCWDREKDNLYSATPENAFVEKHAFTLQTDRKNPFRIEHDLSKLESSLGPVVEKVIGHARKRKTLSLSETEEEVIRQFFLIQMRRAKQMREKIRMTVEQLTIAEHGGTEQLSDTENARFREDYVSSLFIPAAGDTQEAIFSKGIVIGLVGDSRSKALIIGDNPVVGSTPNKIPITDPNATIAIPIASDVALSLMGNSDHRDGVFLDDYVKNLNHVVSWQSDLVGSRSPRLTRALRNNLNKARRRVANPI